MQTQNLMMNMVAQTSIHAGAGQALSVIDLPIQREGHTQHPVIFGSSLKGALRFRASQTLEDQQKLFNVFGADSQNPESFAGAIMVSDAKLLLLPVRSLNGYFKWVTSPALLRRYAQDCERTQVVNNEAFAHLTFSIAQNEVLVAQNKHQTLFLEEFALTATTETKLDAIVAILAERFALDKQALAEQIAVVNDDMFSYLAQNSTPVNAHIALDENKTVKKGALWYEETLPAETVMYSVINCTVSRAKDGKLSPSEVSDVLTQEVLPESNRYLQVGGNETVGMGWFKISFVEAK